MADNVVFTNNASAVLAASISAVDTTIQVASGFGANFPAPSSPEVFYATLISDAGDIEVVKCTSRTGDNLTVVRAQDGTTAQAFTLTTTRVELRVTKIVLEEFLQKNGGTMTGNVDFNQNSIVDAYINGANTRFTAGQIVGVPLRGAVDQTSNELNVPASGRATVGGAAILATGDDIVAELDTAGVIILDSATIGVRIPASAYLRLEGASAANYIQLDHDDTDGNLTFANATDLNISGLSGDIVLASGIDLNLGNNDLHNANVRDFSFESQTKAAATTVDIDYQLGSYVTINMSATALTNLVVSNVPTKYASVRLKIVQDATGGRNIANWPGTTKWANGTVPPLGSAAASSTMFVDLWTDDGGTTWYGGYSALSWS